MIPLQDHRILILGWPVRPSQDWLSEYPTVSAVRIYQEDLPRQQKRLKDLSFHMPKALQFSESVTPSYWYGDWKEHIADYDTVILIDEVRGGDVFEYILDHNPSCNLCVFYDSPIRTGTPKEPSRYRDMPIRFFTCDHKIADTYHIEFAPYFYIFSPRSFTSYENLPAPDYERDVFFIGEEKGDRRERIDSITKTLNDAGLTHKLVLVPQNRHRSLFHRHRKSMVGYMPYSEVQRYNRTSRAILELISDGQTGITQRPYEAMFLQKKLITTSNEIRSYDFYHPDNVFVLGERSLSDLPEFLHSPFHPIPDEVKAKYALEGWLQNFLVR